MTARVNRATKTGQRQAFLRERIPVLVSAVMISVIATMLLPLYASSHPGKKDKKGCHVCRKNCEKWGVKKGVVHCHGPNGVFYPDLGPGKKVIPGNLPKEAGGRAPEKPKRTTKRAYVEKVTDGDTIEVRLLPEGKRITVRILGIDCPESHRNSKCKRDGRQGRHGCDWQVPQGIRASKAAAALLKHKTVILECDGPCTKGGYGRELRYVRLPSTQAENPLEDGTKRRGLDFGLEMVRKGLCEDF